MGDTRVLLTALSTSSQTEDFVVFTKALARELLQFLIPFEI